ncbi:MAG: prolyl oligopeptidase family protein [Piscinibacter sp.]|uniref:prolyl oligopeptidase family serine peptidase n=1 Tax=Piscinibacter sp. TaxID=1903157 RepID=UPI003D14B6E6
MADTPPAADDPHLWLEEVQGEKALAWVRERNAETLKLLSAREDFAPTRTKLLEVLNSKDRIPAVTRRGNWLYNLWQDATHKRGLWRRTTLAEYRKAQPQWETVLDLDALAAAEKENWVWGGVDCLEPAQRLCMLSLSRGGADAKVIREFDIERKRFVDGGFVLPEAKTDVAWADADTLYVGTDFGSGSMTDSGYPRILKRWKRGTPLAEAKTVFEGRREDTWVGVSVDHTPGFERTLVVRALDFYRQETFLLQGDTLQRLEVPDDARIRFMHSAGVAGDTLLLELRSDWRVGERVHPKGSLLAADFPAYQRGERRFQVLFEPTETRSLAGVATTRTHVLVNVNDNVIGRLEEWKREADGRFVRRVVDAPSPGNLGVVSLHEPARRDDPLAEQYLLSYTDFLTPDSLLLGRTGTDRREPLKSLPPSFDSIGMRAEQLFATGRDGTRVPYFVVWPRGAKADGSNPTLLYGYGGFQISLEPWYSRGMGAAWYSRGGVLVVANIRGGGEFGPRWHQAAIRENKQRSYDDFIAVAEDLVRRKITSARHLGIEGGSNGGLLVGAVMTQRPELFNAVVCQVPLLDMKRFHKLLAGASWMAEYGNPDKPEDWAVISRYSPYQNVRRDASYPVPLFTTSTRDDRVHPGHARKMVARLREYGHPVLYYENIEGGHGGAADNEQRATLQAIEFTYLWQRLARSD